MIFGFAVAVACSAFAYFTAAPAILGAHPFWASDVVLWGSAGGILVVAAGGSRALRLRLIGSLVLAGLGLALATWGKAQFAASYGEDALAGRLWHFGWIGVCAFTFAALVLAGASFSPRPD